MTKTLAVDLKTVKLGRNPRQEGVRRLQFAKYFTPTLPTPPRKVYYEYKVKVWDCLGNNTLGDCTAAGIAHSAQNAAIHGGYSFTPTTDQTIDLYSATTGYQRGNPSTDRGGNEDEVLQYVMKNGFCGHELLGYAEIDPRNTAYIKQAIYLFGGIYSGINLPLSFQGQNRWEVSYNTNKFAGFFKKLFGHKDPDPTPGSWGGHCTCISGFGSEGMTNISWGELIPMSWPAWNKYADACYVLLWKDWLDYPVLRRRGFNIDKFQEDLQLLKSQMSYVRVVAEKQIPNFLIRMFLHEPFGHVLFVLDEKDERGIAKVLQCTWPEGVEITTLDKVKDFRHVDFTFDGIDDAIAYGKTLVGRKYDLSNILGFVFNSRIHDPNRLICSRFIVECAKQIGNPLFDPAVSSYHVPPSWLIAAWPRGKKILDVYPKDFDI